MHISGEEGLHINPQKRTEDEAAEGIFSLRVFGNFCLILCYIYLGLVVIFINEIFQWKVIDFSRNKLLSSWGSFKTILVNFSDVTKKCFKISCGLTLMFACIGGLTSALIIAFANNEIDKIGKHILLKCNDRLLRSN